MNIARALNLALDGTLPEWIQLLPAGPSIQGADGRAWTLDDPAALIKAFQQRRQPLVVDWEHASEHRAPQGLEAPAAGWVDQLEVRDGALWGHVDWTPKAAQQIQAREYRYLSPVFTYRKDTLQVVALTSVALTNQPNLDLQALNRKEDLMSLPAALCQALDLPETAEVELAVARVQTLNLALNTAQSLAATPPLEKFVPRPDYDTLLERAKNAEQKLAEAMQAQHAAEVAALVERGLASGQIAPAVVDYYTAMCGYEGGLEAFKSFLEKAPPVIGPPTALNAAKTPEGKALNRGAFNVLDPAAQRAFLARGGVVTD
jgi:phage I-like protein